MTGTSMVEGAMIASNDNPAESVDKIRDILFGGHMKEYDRRFALLEQRLIEEAAQLRRMVEAAIDDLRDMMRQESDTRARVLDDERQDRTSALASLQSGVNELGDSLGSRMQFENERARIELANTRAELTDELRNRHSDVTARLGQLGDDLGRDKTSRAELARLFVEVAQRLNPTD